jgi:hypothetical protein
MERQQREAAETIAELRKALAVTMKDVAAERALRKKLVAYDTRTHDEKLAAAIAQRRALKVGETVNAPARAQ